MTDAPPAGVTVFTFEVTLSGAVLNPGNVDLLAGKGPIRIEVKRLETETAFLNTSNVPAGTYTSLQLTFASPELTFRNDTGLPLPPPLPPCASLTVCEIDPAGTLTSTINLAPGLTIGNNSPTGVLIDLDLGTLLTSDLDVDFSLNNSATVRQVALPNQPTGQFQEIEDLTGIVANKDAVNNRFTLQTAFHGNFDVMVNSSTLFEDFDGCSASPSNFTCVQNLQAVEVDLGLLAGGTFFARKIELEDNEDADDEIEGVIVEVVDSTKFQMVMLDSLRTIADVSLGSLVAVALQGNTDFRVDDNGLNVDSTLLSAFEGAIDTSQLMAGQHVQVRRRTGPPTDIETDRVRLRMSRFTATVSDPPGSSNFNIGSLPGLFPSGSEIEVRTSLETDFDGASGVADLPVGTVVSLRGLLFKGTTPPPILFADKVRKR